MLEPYWFATFTSIATAETEARAGRVRATGEPAPRIPSFSQAVVSMESSSMLAT